ncbi:MAG: zinc transporter, partial [Eubacterium sp.]
HGHEHDHTHTHEGVEGKDFEILNLLLDHWVSHNQDHAKEYKNWVEKMKIAGKDEVAKSIEEAIALMAQADIHLMEAKKQLIK